MSIRRRAPKIREDRIYLGRLIKPHGLKGEFKIKTFGCDPWLFETLETVNLEHPEHVLHVDYVRGSTKAPIIKFLSVNSREESDQLIGSILWVDEANLPELEENTFYESDFLFARVLNQAGEELGRVEMVLETGECDVLVVRNQQGNEIMLPASLDVIKELRKDENLVVVSPPDYEM